MPIETLLPLVRLMAIFALVVSILLIIARWKFPQNQEGPQRGLSVWREVWARMRDSREDQKEHKENIRALRGSKALLVDPDEKSARVMAWQLESYKCSILAAKTGTQGLTLARDHEIDFIIADALLPDISAVDFFRSIPKPGIPLIFVGVTDTQYNELRSLGSNVKCFDKPYNPEEIASLAGYMIKQKRRNREG